MEQLRYEFEPRKIIRGYPELHWQGKRPYESTVYYPAQLREVYGEPKDNWLNKIFWGDNLQVMSHLLREYRGKVDLIYIDPPFDSKADYKKKIKLKGQTVTNDHSTFEEKQYGDIWTNDEYLQFMYERLILMRELLSNTGSIYLHCDYHKSHHLRLLLDEVFGANHFLSEIVWCYSSMCTSKNNWNKKHDIILAYSKSSNYTFNVNDVLDSYADGYQDKFKYQDENGCYMIRGKGGADSPFPSQGDLTPEQERMYPQWTYRQYLKAGGYPKDWWEIPFVNSQAIERTAYPTQKPEALLERIIKASSNPGDLVFDCFMGSGTTQAVAMKLGRRFIGADINLGAIQTTTRRLLSVADDLASVIGNEDKYLGFEVYNVNNYDLFRNPIEARDLILQAFEVQPYATSDLFDGELDGRMVKVMPVNRIATKADLQVILANLPYASYDRMIEGNPKAVVLKLTLICMGHEPDLAAALKQELHRYNVDIEVVDILTDRKELQFKREAEALVEIIDGKVVIQNFYPLNLMQKLSLDRTTVDDWRQLVESIMIDFNFDGAVMQPTLIDIPEKDGLVKGAYTIPAGAGTIHIKITDLLSESLEIEVQNG